VLVHHADAGGDGLLGGAQVGGLPADEDLALVGPVHAVEDLHEGGLARAVLTDDGVDRAPLDPQMDVGVRHHAGEAFGDATQLDSYAPSRGIAG
jgi:hypothetical protein